MSKENFTGRTVTDFVGVRLIVQFSYLVMERPRKWEEREKVPSSQNFLGSSGNCLHGPPKFSWQSSGSPLVTVELDHGSSEEATGKLLPTFSLTVEVLSKSASTLIPLLIFFSQPTVFSSYVPVINWLKWKSTIPWGKTL